MKNKWINSSGTFAFALSYSYASTNACDVGGRPIHQACGRFPHVLLVWHMTLDACHAIFCTPPLRGRGGAPASVLHLSQLRQPRVQQADTPRLFFLSETWLCMANVSLAEPSQTRQARTRRTQDTSACRSTPSRPSQRQCMLPLRYTWTDTSADAGKCSLAGAARSVRRDDATRIW